MTATMGLTPTSTNTRGFTTTTTTVAPQPRAFATLTRGIQTTSVSSKLASATPLKGSEIRLICAYLDNFQTLLLLLDRLPNKKVILSALMNAINRKDWLGGPFQLKNIDQYLLQAVREGLLDEIQFASLSLIQMAKKQWARNPIILPAESEQAQVVLKSSFKALPNQLNSRCAGRSLLCSSQLEEFNERLKKLPSTEQSIALLPLNKLHSEHILAGINLLGLNLFGRVPFAQTTKTTWLWREISLESPESQMIAPLGMVQTFLNVKFGIDAVKLTPVIGPVGIDELRQNSLNGTRVVSVDNSLLLELTGLRLPRKADGLDAPGVYFSYHDSAYHGYLSSAVPSDFRLRFAAISDFIQTHRKAMTSGQTKPEAMDKIFRQLSFKLIDMEHPAFRPEISGVSNLQSHYRSFLNAFWATVMQDLNGTTVNDPTTLTPIAEACWNQLIQKLVEHNIIDEADEDAIKYVLSMMSAHGTL